MREIKVAATQMACSANTDENVDKAIELITQASKEGANIILIQELFGNVYFCKDQKDQYFDLAMPFDGHPILNTMSKVAKEHNVVLPISYFEKSNKAYFNSVAIINADGSILGNYRKSHIPVGPDTKKNFISIQEILDSKSGIQVLQKLELEFVGINGLLRQLE